MGCRAPVMPRPLSQVSGALALLMEHFSRHPGQHGDRQANARYRGSKWALRRVGNIWSRTPGSRSRALPVGGLTAGQSARALQRTALATPAASVPSPRASGQLNSPLSTPRTFPSGSHSRGSSPRKQPGVLRFPRSVRPTRPRRRPGSTRSVCTGPRSNRLADDSNPRQRSG